MKKILLVLLISIFASTTLMAKKGIKTKSRRDVGVHVGGAIGLMGPYYSISNEWTANDKDYDYSYKTTLMNLPIGGVFMFAPRLGFGFQVNFDFIVPMIDAKFEKIYEKDGDLVDRDRPRDSDFSQPLINIEAFAVYHNDGLFGGVGPTYTYLMDSDSDPWDETKSTDRSMGVLGIGGIIGYGMAINKITVMPNFVASIGWRKSSSRIDYLEDFAISKDKNTGDISTFSYYWKFGIAVTYQVY